MMLTVADWDVTRSRYFGLGHAHETATLIRYAIHQELTTPESAAPTLQEFSPFTSGIHLMVYLPSMIYL